MESYLREQDIYCWICTPDSLPLGPGECQVLGPRPSKLPSGHVPAQEVVLTWPPDWPSRLKMTSNELCGLQETITKILITNRLLPKSLCHEQKTRHTDMQIYPCITSPSYHGQIYRYTNRHVAFLRANIVSHSLLILQIWHRFILIIEQYFTVSKVSPEVLPCHPGIGKWLYRSHGEQ